MLPTAMLPSPLGRPSWEGVQLVQFVGHGTRVYFRQGGYSLGRANAGVLPVAYPCHEGGLGVSPPLILSHSFEVTPKLQFLFIY